MLCSEGLTGYILYTDHVSVFMFKLTADASLFSRKKFTS